MAKLTDSKCKQCRASGEKLFLKGDRCFGVKCAMIRKAYRPGVHGQGSSRRRNVSEFGRQLLEKQRIKKIYGILEKQLKRYFRKAKAQKGDIRENLMRKFETRLDNVIFRLGWAKSRSSARQLVAHGHVSVNGKRLDIASYEVKAGDLISLREKIKKSRLIENLAAFLKKYEAPGWLSLDKEKIEAKVLRAPAIEDLGDITPIGLIIESYSR